VEADARALLHLFDEAPRRIDAVVAAQVVPPDVLLRVDALALDGLLSKGAT
jgi:hypothetical protein